MGTVDPTITIECRCEVLQDALATVVEGIKPVLKVRGRYFVAYVASVEKPLSAGQSGAVVVRAVDDGGLLDALLRTKVFELCDGPEPVATCYVLSATEV